MFSLIITIISIVLVAALAIATIYYGGIALNSSSDKAVIARKMNEAQQIKGAAAVYLSDHPEATSFTIAQLVTDSYLKDAPADWSAVSANVAGSDVQTLEMCTQLNTMLGNAWASTTPPTCSSLAAGTEACCSN